MQIILVNIISETTIVYPTHDKAALKEGNCFHLFKLLAVALLFMQEFILTRGCSQLGTCTEPCKTTVSISFAVQHVKQSLSLYSVQHRYGRSNCLCCQIPMLLIIKWFHRKGPDTD